MKEIALPSGAVLKVNPAPFADSKALYQAILEEAKGVSVVGKSELGGVIKDLLCIGFSSKLVEARLKPCLDRCTYNSGKGDLKLDSDTFEPVEARQDYPVVCMEVTKENVSPFLKSLYAEWQRLLAMIPGDPPLKSSPEQTAKIS